ncbi:hypothetical protein CWI84_03670 [Idiomarina tyrosinivorans]|uniref:DUF3530 domain-containing protein n=1 Tax=Idiomarina tyrosinivorans TaxID=1445662 RepID=A0A432ZS04_9GAMM|nr:DUF3530 family protein [Idiomarina tyrosinivorans]RUO80694.1 hypothetical protein CWI84_03670 [Idiomarina tyrosinivorans]
MRIHSVFLLYASLMIAAPMATAQDDLQRYIPPEHTEWLTGENDARYLALSYAEMTPYVRGASLLIADWNRHPLQSPSISRLLTTMPDFGWHTFAFVAPPEPLQTDMLQVPATGPSEYPQPVNDDVLQPLLDDLGKRLAALQQRADALPGFRLWVAEGISAGMLLRWLQQHPEQMPDGLIVIDAYMPQYQLNRELAKQLAETTLPVLDLVTDSANRWAASTVEYRRQLAHKNQHLSYRQQRLYGRGAPALRQLAASVKGWTKYQGF